MPRKARKPLTSVAVVTKIELPRAGSSLNRLSARGTVAPARPATVRLIVSAMKSTQGEDRVALPEEGDEPEHQAGSQAVHQADQGLAEHDAAAAAEVELAEGQAAHDDGEGLGAGVAPHAGDDRHEDREDHVLGDGLLEEADDACGQEGRAEVDHQPGQAQAHRSHRRGRQAVLDVEIGQPVEILGRLRLDDVEDVVDGDRTGQQAVFVDHRHHQQVVAPEVASDLLLRRVDANRDDLRGHDLAQFAFGRRRDELPETGDAEQVPALVDNVEVEEAPAFGEAADAVEGLLDALVGEEARHVGVHQAAGRGRSVAHQVA